MSSHKVYLTVYTTVSAVGCIATALWHNNPISKQRTAWLAQLRRSAQRAGLDATSESFLDDLIGGERLWSDKDGGDPMQDVLDGQPPS